jgi:subtilisin-like proprotein convertase family protein
MTRKLTISFLIVLLTYFNPQVFAQNKWALVNKNEVIPSKNTLRESFPTDFQLYKTSFTDIDSQLKKSPKKLSSQKSHVIISIPNLSGVLERYEIYEFSNFEPALQAQFPEIRSYVGKGIDDENATIRLSSDPKGIQVMVFRTDKRNEFIEPYSEDGKTYVIYESKRNKGALPFTCSTIDSKLANDLSNDLPSQNRSSAGQLLLFRLALSCNGEYATYHGGTVAGALAAMNATMTRVNGVFEKDLAVHMNIIANNTSVIFTNSSTDPYSTTLSQWNAQLQATLTSIVGESNYDIGHMFGVTGGGGNAGCIGCVCVDGQKGSGITSPSDGIPMGDNFDIDYVAHEMGHQFGGNHSFSHNIEGTGVNVEPGSGSTIMGYAGITTRDVQPHSDDYFVYANIKQIQDNMVGKTCPTRVTLTNNAPIVNAGLDYTIPKSTPFVLKGSGTDANGDVLSYCWEENDTATTQSGASSAASATKTGGPNWRSYSPVSTPIRYFPPLDRVIANQTTTQGTEIVVEALSSVSRDLNFVLTARDNYVGAGQTSSDAMKVTVNASAGPFAVSSPNTAVSWVVGSNQNITWSEAGTTANGINASFVDIFLSTDGGLTYPIQLASKVPNDGSETITVPNNLGTTNRIMVKGYNHIFYDISNANFTITAPTSTFSVSFNGIEESQNKDICTGSDTFYEIKYETFAGFSGTTTFSVTGQPTGVTTSFTPSSATATGNIILNITNTTNAVPGFYTLSVTGTSGAITKTVDFYLLVNNSVFSQMSLTSPANLAYALPTSITLNWAADTSATSYVVQVATDEDFISVISTQTIASTSFNLNGLNQLSNYFWRVQPRNTGCFGSFSAPFRFTTGQQTCVNASSTNVPLTISATGTPTINSTLTIPAGSNVTISDINVTMSLVHSYISDLTLTLISPSGTQVQLVSAQCGASSNLNATFDDSGTVIVCGTSLAISGTVLPSQPLSAFNGQSSQGNWTLRVSDSFNADGGSLNTWSLNICSIPNTPITCGQIATTWNGTSWTNGKPVNNVAATINGDLALSGDLDVCSLDIIGTSQVVLQSNSNLTVDGIINVAPTANFTIENNANLIQNQNVVNVANAIVKRNSNPLMRLDYTIWSSPVTGTQTLKNFSPNTLTNRFYNYNTSTNFYELVANPLTQTFNLGKGYLIRMPDNHPTTPTIWNGEFAGNLNNGTINANLSYVSATQNYNMIGNPYPSTISAENLISNNTATISGAIYFWRKINNASGTAYASYTLGGATTTSPTSPTPNGMIQVGQGFFVRAKNVATPKVTFTNALRTANNDNQFFRTNSDTEKNRIWLNLTNDSGLFVQMLAGYMTGATSGYDDLLDAVSMNDSQIGLTSLVANEEYSIQLKALPFDVNDVVPLNFKTDAAGNYSIAIDHVDGLFETTNQEVYLRDNMLQVIHNLSNAPYTFSSEIGNFANRFEIAYQNTLATTTPTLENNLVTIATANSQIEIKSLTEKLSKVSIYDLLGRSLYFYEKVDKNELQISTITAHHQALLVKIELQNGQTVIKKIVF